MNNSEINGFRQDFMIAEGHAHLLFAYPIDETVEMFRKSLAYYGYERLQLLAIPCGTSHSADDRSANIKAIYCKKRLSPAAYAAAGLFHTYDDRCDTADEFLRQARLAYSMGFDGFKMLEGKPRMRKNVGKRLDDPVYHEFYAFAQEKGMPITMHVADPPVMWNKEKISEYALKAGWLCDETYPTKEELHAETEGILQKFPDLRLVLAHFNFFSDDILRTVAWMDKYPNLYFDMTPGAQMFLDFSAKPEEWKAFFKKYKNRLIYGSDFHNFRTEQGTMYCPHTLRINQLRTFLETDKAFAVGEETAYGIALPDDALLDIYCNNFYALYGEPRAVDSEAVLSECEALLQTETDGLNLSNLQTIKAVFSWQK